MKTILKDGTILNSHDLPDHISTKISEHHNFFEYKLLNQLKKINAFGDGDIIEIGANVGNHVVYYKTQLNNSDRTIVAFEPLEANYSILEKNIVDNKLSNVDVRKYGLGPKTEKATFYVNETNFGNSSLLKQKESSKKTTVQIKEVVSELEPLMSKSSFAKIDIEGAEKYIFDSLIKTFAKPEFAFLIEINRYEYDSVDEYIAQFEKIRKAGFKLICMPDENNFLWSSRKADKDIYDKEKLVKNYFAYFVRNIRNAYDASKTKAEREKLTEEYQKISNQFHVALFRKLFWSQIFVFFKRS